MNRGKAIVPTEAFVAAMNDAGVPITKRATGISVRILGSEVHVTYQQPESPEVVQETLPYESEDD